MAARPRFRFAAYNLRLVYPRNPLFTYYAAVPAERVASAPVFLQRLLNIRANFEVAKEADGDTFDVSVNREAGWAERIFNTAGFEAITIPKLVVVNQRIRLIVEIPLAFSSLDLDPPKLLEPPDVLALIDAQYPRLGLGGRIEFDEPPNWDVQLKAKRDRLTKDQVIFYYLALREIRVYFERMRDLGEVSEALRAAGPTVELPVTYRGEVFPFAFPRGGAGAGPTVREFLEEVNYLTGISGTETFVLQLPEEGAGAGAFLYTPARRGETPLDDLLDRAARRTGAALEFRIEPAVRVETVKMRAVGRGPAAGPIVGRPTPAAAPF